MAPTIKTFKNLKAAEKETRKQLIIDAAERVFAHKPHDHVSMKEIAAEAGIATASIYNYFQNQEDLFIESFIRDAGALIADLKVLSADGARPRYREIIETFIDYFTNKDSYFRMMANFMLYGKISENSLEKFNAIFREMLDNFEKAFIGDKESSETRYYSHIMFAFLNGLLINFRKYPGRSEEEVVGHMKKLGDIFSRLLEQIPTK
jgi:AcrR family transcriptional regulator